jgi:hypothetical protein
MALPLIPLAAAIYWWNGARRSATALAVTALVVLASTSAANAQQVAPDLLIS